MLWTKEGVEGKCNVSCYLGVAFQNYFPSGGTWVTVNKPSLWSSLNLKQCIEK